MSDSAMDLTSELKCIVDCLDAASLPYALCGGLAVALHGYVRATRDIDLLIRPEQVDVVMRAVQSIGFNLEGGTIPLGYGETYPLDVHRISRSLGHELVTLDLVVVNPTLEPVWRSRQLVDWDGQSLWCVSRDGLGVMKRLSRRPQDLLDLEQLGIITNDA